mgnify:CR=1 FL=1
MNSSMKIEECQLITCQSWAVVRLNGHCRRILWDVLGSRRGLRGEGTKVEHVWSLLMVLRIYRTPEYLLAYQCLLTDTIKTDSNISEFYFRIRGEIWYLLLHKQPGRRTSQLPKAWLEVILKQWNMIQNDSSHDVLISNRGVMVAEATKGRTISSDQVVKQPPHVYVDKTTDSLWKFYLHSGFYVLDDGNKHSCVLKRTPPLPYPYEKRESRLFY